MGNSNDTSQIGFNYDAVKSSVGRLTNIQKTEAMIEQDNHQKRLRPSVADLGKPYKGVGGAD